MNIGLVRNLYPPLVQGGAEIHVGRLARALAEDHPVAVITTQPGFHLAPRREVTPEGIAVYRLAPLNVAHKSTFPRLCSVQSSAPHIPVAMTLYDYGLSTPMSIRHPDGHS